MKTGCPTKKKLTRAFEGRLSTRAQFRLLDHIYGCSRCKPEFDALRQVWSQSRELLSPLENIDWSEASRRRLCQLASQEAQGIRGPRQGRVSFWKAAFPAVSAALGLIILISAVLFHKGPGKEAGERSFLPWQIDLLQPKGSALRASLVFRWHPLRRAESYGLEVFDKGLDLVYERSGIAEESIVFPVQTALGLKKGEVYFWRIKATLKDNQVIESDFSKFILKDD